MSGSFTKGQQGWYRGNPNPSLWDGFFIWRKVMLEQLEKIEKEALKSLGDVKNQDALEEWRVKNLGRR